MLQTTQHTTLSHKRGTDMKDILQLRDESKVIELSETLGNPLQAGTPASYDQLLALVDMTAGSAAYGYGGARCATGCFDFLGVAEGWKPLQGDIARSEGRILNVGTRSLLTRVDVYINDDAHSYIQALITFVIRGRDVQLKRLPDGSEQGDELANRLKQQRKMLTSSNDTRGDSSKPVGSISEVDEGTGMKSNKKLKLNEEEENGNVVVTELQPELRLSTYARSRQVFLPRDMNGGGVLFGGIVLSSCVNVALASARKILNPKDRHSVMCLLHMKALSFHRPVPQSCLFAVEAVVTGVRDGVACVNVRGYVEEFLEGDGGGNDGDDNNNENGMMHFYHNRVVRKLSHTGLLFVAAGREQGQDMGVVKNGMMANGVDHGTRKQREKVIDLDEEEYDMLYKRSMSICTRDDFDRSAAMENEGCIYRLYEQDRTEQDGN